MGASKSLLQHKAAHGSYQLSAAGRLPWALLAVAAFTCALFFASALGGLPTTPPLDSSFGRAASAFAGGQAPVSDLLDQRSCRRMLWLSGLQAVTSKGGESRYLDSSSNYLRYYAAALKSAQLNAPSLLPVLVFFNEAPPQFLQWVQEQGALVIQHHLTFYDRIAEAVRRHPKHSQLKRVEHLVASYARLDVPAIVDKVARALGRSPAAAQVDWEYVLWTDPDVLFETDIDGCSLAKPRIVSIGAETIPGTVANCGVMYFNLTAFAETQQAMLAFGDSLDWKVDHDQDLFRRFYKRWQITALPDAYNYKPYWGDKEFVRPAPLFENQALAEIAIIHTHGPKPETALCVADFIRAREVDVSANRDAVLAHIPDLIRDCRLQNMPWLDICLRLAASAVAADGGSMYQRVQRLHASLCPGVCWMPQEAGGHAHGRNSPRCAPI